jgi:hypothetical protein
LKGDAEKDPPFFDSFSKTLAEMFRCRNVWTGLLAFASAATSVVDWAIAGVGIGQVEENKGMKGYHSKTARRNRFDLTPMHSPA